MSSIRVSTWLFWEQCYQTALQSREGARTLEENNLVPRVLSYLSQQDCEENPWNSGHKNPGISLKPFGYVRWQSWDNFRTLFVWFLE